MGNRTPAAHRDQVQVKLEPDDPDCPPTPSVGPGSVWEGNCTSIQMASVDPSAPVECVGNGSKTLQFFYQNPLDDIKIGFPPVRVNTEEEVNCVVSLVTEKAEEFNRRNNLKQGDGKPVQYYSSAVRARSLLDQDIVRYIHI